MADEQLKPREHHYHAEATVLSGHLQTPLVHEIKPQANAKLPEHGGYLSQEAKDYRLEQVIHFTSAHTQVAGNPELKDVRGWTTLTTSVVEGLNILDVVTADRVVAQVSAHHPHEGYVPKFSFLGTHFHNLRIAGHPVKIDMDANMLGDSREENGGYGKAREFLKRVESQYETIRGSKNAPPEMLERYKQAPSGNEKMEWVECSLVNKIECAYPEQTSFGHVIDVPNFGKIYLATLRLEQSDPSPTGVPQATLVQLTMIELHLGCIAHGTAAVSQGVLNGRTRP